MLQLGSVLLSTSTDVPVSVLTSERRDTWANARDKLRSLDPANAESLNVVETALFCVSFEDGYSHDLEVLARACLHGNGRNKWFDKPFNLVVFQNGRVGVNGEVSPCCDVSGAYCESAHKCCAWARLCVSRNPSARLQRRDA